MTELEAIFVELGISHYLNDFIEQGFDSWDTILDITESDFDALGVKLGHRRKLQRKIANSRGFSPDRALASPTRNTPSDDRQVDEQRASSAKAEGKELATGSGPQGAKRKYRRHPKPDENAPERPPSAYVIFSNKMREDLKGRNLSFTEIAKLVGENWQGLSPGEKEPYEQQAFSAKERYNAELAEYKKTSQYREYSQYLVEFKARQLNQQQAVDADVTKRPKLEKHTSATSSGTASSSTSQHGKDTPTGRISADPSPTSTNQWSAHDGHHSPALPLPIVQASKSHGSPSLSSSVVPIYRPSVLGSGSQSLPWRENNHDESNLPLQQRRRVAGNNDNPTGHMGHPVPDGLSLTGALQHVPRMGQGPPPPSTSASGSSASTNSSAFLSPRTPLEPLLDRPLTIPSLFSQQSTAAYENQLPPLMAPSLSPQSATQHCPSPNSAHPNQDFPTSMAPMRGYAAPSPQQGRSADGTDSRIREFGTPEDSNLDPVSALLRAGEIVNRNSRGHPPS